MSDDAVPAATGEPRPHTPAPWAEHHLAIPPARPATDPHRHIQFDVAEDPWIRVWPKPHLTAPQRQELARLLPHTPPDGPALTGLRALFTAAHLLDRIEADHPPVESVLRRLLAALTARISGLDDDQANAETWLEHREQLLDRGAFDPARVEDYFQRRCQGRWNLYGGAHPFLQDPRLASEAPQLKPPARLAMNRPSGNNAAWSHLLPQDTPLTPAESVNWLLAWQGYGPSGTASTRTHGTRSDKTCNAGPYRRRVCYFPLVPGDLFATLVLSVPDSASWPTGPGPDLAPFEATDLPDPLNPQAPAGPVSLLTARTAHAVLLDGDAALGTTGCRIVWATTGGLPAANDPYLIHRSKGGPLPADHTRQTWRDLDALLLKERPGKETAYRPAIFNTIADLPVPLIKTLAVRALGWDQGFDDRNRQWSAATTPPVLACIEEHDPQAAATVAAAREQAEALGHTLRKTLLDAWTEATEPTGATPNGDAKRRSEGFLDRAMTHYWQLAEDEFWTCLNNTDHQPAYRHAALEVFDTAAASLKNTTQGIQAAARARARLATPPRTRKAPAKTR
ncbi:type I-E CRISPR-associated protein Cse1/CasA [Streptomyces sp. NPDC001941]|uniref:type I-E CRISPR-associated protein Cse1/CasA n=1 Tax=Streptomyces sp. NPDC001941 TaxID=3154659 RepID=UPI00332575C6